MDNFYIPEFYSGDAVYYHGDRYRSDLITKDGKSLKGWIHAPVRNQPGVFVVEFPDAKEPDYVISARFLSKARISNSSDERYSVEIQPRRRKISEDSE